MQNISSVGACIMGHGLATMFVLGAYRATLHDIPEGTLARARKLKGKCSARLQRLGGIDPHASLSTLEDHTTCSCNLAESVAHADLVSMPLKL